MKAELADAERVFVLQQGRVVYRTERVETHALNGVDLEVAAGEFLTIQGRSGSGKSTLLSVLGLLEPLTEGRLILLGQDVSGLGRSARAALRRRHLGFVFQAFHLLPDLSVAENIALPMVYDGRSPQEVKARVEALAAQFDLLARLHHLPTQLSGGQQQRVAIARALANEPSLLLVDEPTGNLDEDNANIVLDMLAELHRAGRTICMVTHDPASAARGTRRLRMRDGRLLTEALAAA
jgi:putative ABC transport system ATP-binding protein